MIIQMPQQAPEPIFDQGGNELPPNIAEQEFVEWLRGKLDEFIPHLKAVCEEKKLYFKELGFDQMQNGPVFQVEDEAYVIYKDGFTVGFRYVGKIQ